MANNQNVNKVVYGGTTLIDLTADDVAAGDVLSGKKFHLKSGAQGIGTCTYDATTSDATATAGDILSDKTAYVKSRKITGTIPVKPAQTYTPGTTNQTISSGTYLKGAQTISGDSNLIASNIADGVSIFGVTGTFKGAWYAHIVVKYPAGSTCTCKKSGVTYTAPDTSGLAVFTVNSSGTWVVSCTNGTSTKSANVSVSQGTAGGGESGYYPVHLSYWTAGTFSGTSDANFAALIRAAHNGEVNLQNDLGWAVGDTRQISVAAWTDAYGVETPARAETIVLSSFSNYENCGCVCQFDFRDMSYAGHMMNNPSTNSGGYRNTAMKTTTLPAFVEAMPDYLKGLLIEFSCKSAAGSGSSTIYTVTGNKLALRSQIEVTGTNATSKAGEGVLVDYYATAANRNKGAYWWLRSPYGSSSVNFCGIKNGGVNDYYGANYAGRICPFGCL